MTFIFWRAGSDLGAGSVSGLAPNTSARITSEQAATETEPVVDAADAAAIAGTTKQLSAGGKVCYTLDTTQLPAGTYQIYVRYRSGGGTLTVDQSSQLLSTTLPARSTATYTGNANINGHEFVLLEEYVTLANEATTVCIEATSTLYFDELYLIQTDSIAITDVNQIQFWGLDSDQYPDPTPHGLVRAESDDPLWSGDAPQVYDASAIGATAIAVGENGGTPHEQDAAIPNVDAGSYRVLVRYRFSGTSPSQGYVRFNQTGQTQQSLDVPVVTPAATFDGTISYNGRSGYYNLGTVTLVAGTLNLKVVGPASTGDAVVFDDIVLSPIADTNNDTRTVYGLTRVRDNYNSGTPRQMLPKYGITLNGSTEYASTNDNGKLLPFNGGATYTFTAWVNLTTAGDALFSANGEVNGGWAIYVNATTLRFLSKQSSGAGNALVYDSFGFASITGTGWRHIAIAATVDADGNSGSATFWLDGVLLGTSVIQQSGGYADGSQDFTIGCRNKNTNFFDGSADDLRVYSGELTDAQVAEIAALKPGSQSGANVGVAPLIHYKCEDSVTSKTLRNSGTLGSVADATITTAAIATVRGTASPVYSFANSVGGAQAYVTDGVDDYLDTQLTLNGASSFTVWRRARYLSTSGWDTDGFQNVGASHCEIGRGDGTNLLRFSHGQDGATETNVAIPNGRIHSAGIRSTANGTYSLTLDGVEVDSATATGFTIPINNTLRPFLIGTETNNAATPSTTQNSHAEYYEYLIADRVLTDDELTWLETGGQAGTAIDFEGDANILLYTDFSQQTSTQIVNQANPNLPILKAVGGELTMVPRSEGDTTKDIDQAAYSRRSALYFPGDVYAKVDMGQQLIPGTGDFDIAFDFLQFAEDASDQWQTLISQFTGNSAAGRLWVRIDSTTNNIELELRDAPGNVQIQTATNSVTIGKWHRLQLTRVGDVYTIYIDGIVQAQTTLAGQTVETANTHFGHGPLQLTSHDEFNGLISNIEIDGQQWLTTAGETISGATLTNASYVDVVRGKPGTIQHTGIAPRDMPLTQRALRMFGSTDKVTHTSGPIIPYEGDFSVEVVFLTNDTTRQVIWGQYRIGEARRALMEINCQSGVETAGWIQLYINGMTGSYFQFEQAVPTGVWNKLTVSRTSGVLRIQGEFGDGTACDETQSDSVEILQDDFTIASATGLDLALNGQVSYAKVTDGVTTLGEWAFVGTDGVEPDLSGNERDLALSGTVSSMRGGSDDANGLGATAGTLVRDGYCAGQHLETASTEYLTSSTFQTTSTTKLSGLATFVRDSSFSGAADAIHGQWDAGDKSWLLYIDGTESLRFNYSDDGTTSRSASGAFVTVQDVIYNVQWTFDSGELKMYRDGRLLQTETIAGTGTMNVGGQFAADIPGTPTNLFGGTIYRHGVEDGVCWTDEQVQAINDATTVDELRALRPNLNYWADGKTEVIQGLGALTANGTPDVYPLPAMQPVSAPFAYGYRYNGSTGYFNKGSRLTSGALTALSAGCWVRRDANSTMAMLAEYRFSDNNRAWQYYLHSDGTQRVHLSSDGNTGGVTEATSGAIALGEIAHVAFTYDGTTVTFYVNGVATTSTQGSGSIPASLFDSTSEFTIASFNNGSGSFVNGLLSQVVVHAGVAWSPTNVAAVMAAGTAAGVQSAISGLGGTAWFFEKGNGDESLQGIAKMQSYGTPFQTIIAGGDIPKTQPAGTVPPGLPPVSHGPGVLSPGCSLDLYANESDSPYALRLDALLADGTYDQGDGDEASTLFVRSTLDGDDRLIIRDPAAAGAELTALTTYTT